jgi:hypothetical protein
MIYSNFKKSQAQVTNVEAKEPKGKGKARAKIEEVMAGEEEGGSQEEQEDFPEGN